MELYIFEDGIDVSIAEISNLKFLSLSHNLLVNINSIKYF